MKVTFLLYFFIQSVIIFATPSVNIKFTLKGQVIESSTSQPVEFATVSIIDKASNTLIGGETTDENGNFLIKIDNQDIIIEVSFIGFETVRIDQFECSGKICDLGIIEIGTDAELLDEVVVRAEKSTTEFRLDKRVFNVGQDLSSSGAGALDVLDNVPSVTVNVEGQVSLRGSSGVQILINGKPSVLASEQGNALGSITADMIEKVEVITNPSAKYEAEGTSGIINIVLKKDEKKGVNGSVTVNTGWPHNHSLGLSINRRSNKWNVFSQAGVGYRSLPNQVENNIINNQTGDRLESTGEEFRNETFYNFVLGTDYYINPLNVITLSGSFAYEVEEQPSEIKLLQSRNTPLGPTFNEWNRSEVTEATNPKFQYELQYKRDFKDDKEHDLLFSAIGNFFGKDQSSVFNNQPLRGTLPVLEQLTATSFEEGRYTFKLDYTRPFNNKITLEAGAQYVINDVLNDFEVQDRIDGEFVNDPNFTNSFEYHQDVLGVYSTLAYEQDAWGVKGGLRVENTDLNTLLITTNEANNQNFTNLFPSFATSYKFDDHLSFQAGYSRRIYRPRLWDLNPFFNIRNNFAIRTGNPDLLPEFTDSYEGGIIYIIGQISTNANIFYRYTNAVIERINTFEDNVTFTSPYNLGTRATTGVEWNAKYSPNKLLTLSSDFNFNTFSRKGSFEGNNFDFSASQWNARLDTKYKFSNALEAEVSGRYESSVQTVQGKVSENLFMNLGVRYKLFKGRLILNLGIRDVFASRIRESIAVQGNNESYSFRQRGRFITFGVSYGFGKGEAMEFSGRRRR